MAAGAIEGGVEGLAQGAVSGGAQGALQDGAWDQGVAEGLGQVAQGGFTGAALGLVGGAVGGGLFALRPRGAPQPHITADDLARQADVATTHMVDTGVPPAQARQLAEDAVRELYPTQARQLYGEASDAATGGALAHGGPSATARVPYVAPQADAKVLRAAERLRLVGVGSSEAGELVEGLAKASTHGSGDRVVLGKWAESGGYVKEAVDRGGIYFQSAEGVYEALGSKDLAWAVNEQFLLDQLRAGVARIDFVGESIAYVERSARNTARWREIQFLKANASRFGYELRGNSWIKIHPAGA
jgi:hypothetical protein